jgi:hypothetical protein
VRDRASREVLRKHMSPDAQGLINEFARVEPNKKASPMIAIPQ